MWSYMRSLCNSQDAVQHISLAIILVMFITSVAFSLNQTDTKMVVATNTEHYDSNIQHTAKVEHGTEIIDFMAYILIAVFTALVGLVLWNVKDMKDTNTKQHDEIRIELGKKLDIRIHNLVCDKQIPED